VDTLKDSEDLDFRIEMKKCEVRSTLEQLQVTRSRGWIVSHLSCHCSQTITCVCALPDGLRVISACGLTLSVWNLLTGECEHELTTLWEVREFLTR
jgi:WD40 repeat protein